MVCPMCGYVQPAPVDVLTPPTNKSDPESKLENPIGPTRHLAEEIPWSELEGTKDDDYEAPITEEEHTDRVEIPAELAELERQFGSTDIPMNDVSADEPTPADIEEKGLLDSQDELFKELELPGGDQDEAVLVREPTPDHAKTVPVVSEWHLKTPSGLTFKFTDPEALLGWKKKLATYQELQVSPDGTRWVDFARFVREYEEVGDPFKAFILSASLGDGELPPPKPPQDEVAEVEEPTADEKSSESEKGRTSNTGHQFTFKVKEDKTTGWGRYLLLAILGLGLGAGIVLVVLYLTGAWNPPV